ncbi:ferric reductase transmembrane component 1 [Achaetomium macrosporum]|uniref:Ferric reductase transmembrane component 1 n=1 Tax=Achaetomium macrosporum TaxID=79813 RepID=A0AAN7C2U7_9PEZI|nr:ferric reductase transmembrane component 1 [Achaetomium macrosporum]
MDRTQACSRAEGAFRGALPAFVRAFCPATPAALSEGDSDWMDDPEKVEYIRKLIESIYEARAIVTCYNLAILLVLAMVTVWHWHESRSDRQKWRRLRQCPGAKIADGISSTATASSSGIATVVDAVKDLDLERAPLLARNRATVGHRKSSSSFSRALRSWLTRQPAPLPVVHRTLPSNGTSLFILAWLALNFFFHFFRLPLRRDYFFIFADRAGFVFIVNLPLLYLLGAKNQPLRRLTGYSYEALNIFHRRVGELMCFEAAVHLVGMLLWQFVLSPQWLLASRTARAYFTHPLILCGLGALVAYELLYFTSLASFRQRWYELFLATHVLLQAAALVFLWFHFYTAQPYIALSLAIFLTDRLVWRLSLKRADITADLVILDKDTYTLSANWDIPSSHPPQPRRRRRWWWRWYPSFLLPQNQSILYGWHPTDHVFLTVPSLGPTHALQAHPFTIASAAPGRRHVHHHHHHSATDSDSDSDFHRRRTKKVKHAWLTLLIRAHKGFTRDLLAHCMTHNIYRLPVRLDGPYGAPPAQHRALSTLRASGCAVLVAGGSGIAVVFPLAWALLFQDHFSFSASGGDDGDGDDTRCAEDGDGKLLSAAGFGHERGKRKVHLLWVTHSREHREWVAGFPLQELVERGLELVIPEPTAEAGRPDVRGMVSGWIGDAAGEGKEVGVVVSGPDGLNRAVRNVVADEIGRGREVRVAVEKFGW